MSLSKAIDWMLNNWNDKAGVVITCSQRTSYPEVSGYYIPTLLNLGFKDKATQTANWLASIQNEDGSWSLQKPGPKFTFDTSQILFGLSFMAGYEETKKKGIAFLKAQVKESGEISTEHHANGVPPEINIWTAAILDIYGETELATKVWKFYDRDETFKFNILTHFYCYILDACLYGSSESMKKRAMDSIISLGLNVRDGVLSAYPNGNWCCYTGAAQLAILLYNIGQDAIANEIMKYLEKAQLPNGGFLGSNGEYFPDQQPSWAVKFYIDAYLEKIKSDFNINAEKFPWDVPLDDCRCDKVLKTFKDFAGKRILDIGCGRGRFARRLAEKVGPSIAAVDISMKMLEGCNNLFEINEGSILNIPYSNESFNGVYAIEVVEHVPFLLDNAFAELNRILVPGGKVLIIDKHKEALKPSDKLSEWEDWLDVNQTKEIMKKYFKEVSSVKISDLFTAWEGVK